MDYKEEYNDIFAYTRALLIDDIEEDVKFIKECQVVGHQLSIGYLEMVAENLTAYNEIYPYPEFVPLHFFITL